CLSATLEEVITTEFLMKKWKIWLEAARPKTLFAGFVPVLTGASLAWADQAFHGPATLVALFCALSIQIGTNFANDYFDFIKGIDTDARIGFQRATASGWISPGNMLLAAISTMGLAFIAGLYLVWLGGWVVFWIGIFSLLFGILYTGGPFPLGYNGLGDLFVFIFFGLVAVTGTYYVNTLAWSPVSAWLSLPVGALCVNILVVNNLRDLDQDRVTGKNTIGVLLGEQALKIEYALMLFFSYAVLPVLYFVYDYSPAILFPFLSLPFAFHLLKWIWFYEKKESLNAALERTAQFMFLYGILLSAGLLTQPV
ncbi:MAG: 1,4-dihydroxy-2-naphthoate polyprenyltransferase, partial [Balneolaceae bacterium]